MLRWACHAVVAAGTRLHVKDAELTPYRDILENLADYIEEEFLPDKLRTKLRRKAKAGKLTEKDLKAKPFSDFISPF